MPPQNGSDGIMENRGSRFLLAVGLGLALAVFLLLAAGPALAGPEATTRYVAPGGSCGSFSPCYASPQAAVDAAASGDVIKVAQGSYTGVSTRSGHTQVVYVAKDLTLRGGYTTTYADPPDPAAHPTTLDAQGQGIVVYVSYARVTLEGLRLTGGNATDAVAGDNTGGGVRVNSSSNRPTTIRDCWVGGNTAEMGGAGGIAADFCPFVLTGSTVISNTGTGVILWSSSSPVLTGNTIAGNSAGGVTVLESDWGAGLMIQDNTFTGNSGNGIYLNGLDSDGSVIADNTFTGNTRGIYGRFVHVPLRISGNTFHNNSTTENGGAILLDLGDAEVLNNTFTANHGLSGGALCVSNAGTGYTVLVSGNLFDANTATTGGAIYLDGESSAEVRNNFISSNQARDGAGLAAGVGSQVVCQRNVLTSNQATRYAGGLYCSTCTATVEQNQIRGNSAASEGGGAWFTWTAPLVTPTVPILTNNLITDNSAVEGSGVMVRSRSVVMIHNTVAHNLGGAGVHVKVTSLPARAVLTNTILVSHTIGIRVASGSASLQGTLWGDGAWANGSDWVGTAIDTGTVNLWGDPLFVAPASGDYHITAGSPARDQGVDAGVSRDMEGELRPHPDTGIPDIGADEYHLDDYRLLLPLLLRQQ